MGNSTSNVSSGSNNFERFDRSKGTVREQIYTRDRNQALEKRDFHMTQYRSERNTVFENIGTHATAGAILGSAGGTSGAIAGGMVGGASAGIASMRHIGQALSHEFKAGQAQKAADFANKVLSEKK